MSSVERTDQRDHLQLVHDRSVVVLPHSEDATPSEPWCPKGCRWPMICPSCTETVRSEAFRWLRDLADDYYGYNVSRYLRTHGPTPEVQVLWRDPLGVSRLDDLRSPFDS